MTTELTHIPFAILLIQLKENVLIQYVNRDVRSMHILEYKDVGVPSEPLTRQSHTVKSLKGLYSIQSEFSIKWVREGG